MGRLIQIIGPPGGGKSSSVETLKPEMVFYINADKKDLPFKGADAIYNEEAGNYAATSDVWEITDLLKDISTNKPKVKVVVIDTVNAIMLDREMSVNFRGRKKGDEAFGKWLDMAAEVYELCSLINDSTRIRKDLIVYMMCHETITRDEVGNVIERKMVTNGRKLEKIHLESKATVVLFTYVEHDPDGESKFFFETQSRGISTAKSPKGMFEEFRVPNDLKLVSMAIDKFYKPVPVSIENKPVSKPVNK